MIRSGIRISKEVDFQNTDRSVKVNFVKSILVIFSMFFLLSGCSDFVAFSPKGAATSSSTAPLGYVDPLGAGGGAAVPGQGSFSVPTSEAVIARIQNGMQNNVTSTTGNFAKALAQIKSNLPITTDPTKATGFDQVQLLVYSACSDLAANQGALMLSKYNVKATGTIASNQAALVAAGVKMLDQHVAGLASQGPASAQVTTALTTLVSQISAVTANTSTIAFMAVCIAANTAGSSMMGF